MSTPLKGPKKDAVARLRDFYNKVVRKPLTEQDKAEIREVFKKKEKAAEKAKKIAKPNQDMELE